MTVSESVWSLIAVAFGLFGVGWLASLRLSKGSREAVWGLALFNCLMSISLGLIVLRGTGGFWLTHTGSNLLLLVGFLFLWRATGRLFASTPRTWELLLVGMVGGATTIGFGIDPSTGHIRVALLYLVIAGALVHASIVLFSGVARTGEAVARRALVISAWLIAALLGHNAVLALWYGQEIEFDKNPDSGVALAITVLVTIFAMNLAFGYVMLARFMLILDRLARHDMLTGLLNRRALTELLVGEWDRFQRGAPVFTLASIDIDHFKSINDGFGHAAGDAALKTVAAVLRAQLRRGDALGRTGGEEFVALLLGSDLSAAAEVAERMRMAVSGLTDVTPTAGKPVTVSIGLAQPLSNETGYEQTLARADRALYQAKADGRNRVRGD